MRSLHCTHAAHQPKEAEEELDPKELRELAEFRVGFPETPKEFGRKTIVSPDGDAIVGLILVRGMTDRRRD